MKKKNPLKILDEEISEEVLARMPEWFKKLRAEYRKRAQYKKSI